MRAQMEARRHVDKRLNGVFWDTALHLRLQTKKITINLIPLYILCIQREKTLRWIVQPIIIIGVSLIN